MLPLKLIGGGQLPIRGGFGRAVRRLHHSKETLCHPRLCAPPSFSSWRLALVAAFVLSLPAAPAHAGYYRLAAGYPKATGTFTRSPANSAGVPQQVGSPP